MTNKQMVFAIEELQRELRGLAYSHDALKAVVEAQPEPVAVVPTVVTDEATGEEVQNEEKEAGPTVY